MELSELCLRKEAEPDEGALVRKLHCSEWEKKKGIVSFQAPWLCVADEDCKQVAPEKLAREVLSTGPEGKQGTHLARLTKEGTEVIDHMATLCFNDHFCLIVAFVCHLFTRFWIQKKHTVVGIEF